jgi:hypothetical protein
VSLFWFLYLYIIMGLYGGQRLTVLIGIPPPRQRPGRTLGPNLDYAQVSLSLRMCHRLKCNQHLFIARVSIARTLNYFLKIFLCFLSLAQWNV